MLWGFNEVYSHHIPFQLQGYNIINTFRLNPPQLCPGCLKLDSRGGSTSVILKANLNYKVLNLQHCSEPHILKCTGVFVSSIKLTYITIYGVPPVSYKFFLKLDALLAQLETWKMSGAIILAGDFNCHLFKSALGDQLINLMAQYNFVNCTLPLPTFTTATSATVLDVVFTRNFPSIKMGVIETIFGNDHCSSVVYWRPVIDDNVVEYKSRKYTEAAIEMFKREIRSKDWNALCDINNADLVATQVVNHLEYEIQNCFPMVVKKCTQSPNLSHFLTTKLQSELQKYFHLVKFRKHFNSQERTALHRFGRELKTQRKKQINCAITKTINLHNIIYYIT